MGVDQEYFNWLGLIAVSVSVPASACALLASCVHKANIVAIVVLLNTLLALTSANEILSQVAGDALVMLLGLIVALVGTTIAPVHQVVVCASVSACVLISTLPATVVLAFDTDPVALSTQTPPI